MKRNIAIAVVSAVAVAAGSFLGYKLAVDSELRGRLLRGAKDAAHTSKQKMDEMTEEIAVKTAKMTKNPKINQDWVSKQWEQIGY